MEVGLISPETRPFSHLFEWTRRGEGVPGQAMGPSRLQVIRLPLLSGVGLNFEIVVGV